MNIVNIVEEELKEYVRAYKDNSEDHYDFWNEHIKYVCDEANKLAKKYGADEEIVALGALLHDIALVKKIGTREEHHINGKKIAEEILTKLSYPNDQMENVLNCIYNHRSSKNATTLEERCVADADILAHFDNIPMLFDLAYNRNNIKLCDARNWMKESFEKDYSDLSEETKEDFKERYKNICEIILGSDFNE